MFKILVGFAVAVFSGLFICRVFGHNTLPISVKIRYELKRITVYIKYIFLFAVGTLLVVVNFGCFRDLSEAVFSPSAIFTIRNILEIIFGSSSVMVALQNMMFGAIFVLSSFSALAVAVGLFTLDYSATTNDFESSQAFPLNKRNIGLRVSGQKSYRFFARFNI